MPKCTKHGVLQTLLDIVVYCKMIPLCGSLYRVTCVSWRDGDTVQVVGSFLPNFHLFSAALELCKIPLSLSLS